MILDKKFKPLEKQGTSFFSRNLSGKKPLTHAQLKAACGVLICAVFLFSPAFAYEENLFEDEILLETKSLKFNLENNAPKSLRESLKREEEGIEFQKGSVTFFSKAKKQLNDYMVDECKTTTGATLNPNGRLSLTGGIETKNQNPNASIHSKKMYLAPQLRLGEDFSVIFTNKFDNDSKVYENEVGIKYAPKFLKNTKFGVSTGASFDEESLKSRNLKFSTELFLF